MTEHTRRTVLKAAGPSALAVGVAGCTGGDDDDDGNGSENGDENDDGFQIDPETEIVLEGQINGWEGVAPDPIEGETNPTLVLEDGADYEIGWEQGDGNRHNIELWDENEELVDDEYKTELTDEPEETVEFTASDEIAYYRCNPHGQMQGEIRVE